jgi:protein O-GlcNAc transferase
MRIPYENCPLCESNRCISIIHEVDATRHPLYQDQLPPVMRWRECAACGHNFTDGYWSPEAMGLFLDRDSPYPDILNDVETARLLNANVVSWVNRLADGRTGSWLDVGHGNGSLLRTAEEFGYRGYGLDLRQRNVDGLCADGIQAQRKTIEDFSLDYTEKFDVISFADSLEHMPFPAKALLAAYTLLDSHGLLFISCPNTDTAVWRSMGIANPYLIELEHFHNFSRARLSLLLGSCGFDYLRYSVSERYRSGMELVARPLNSLP